MAVAFGANQVTTAIAASDLSSSQYCAVVFSLSSGVLQCDLQSTAGGVADGILQNAPTSGQAAVVLTSGFTLMRANAAITAPADVCVAGTVGRVAVSATSGHRRVGRVFESATAAADFVSGYFQRDGII